MLNVMLGIITCIYLATILFMVIVFLKYAPQVKVVKKVIHFRQGFFTKEGTVYEKSGGKQFNLFSKSKVKFQAIFLAAILFLVILIKHLMLNNVQF
jgi:hypothetical protein